MNTSNNQSSDLAQKSILHLHAAAQTTLSISPSLSAHLGNHLLAIADENDVNLPKSYIETRFCQRCGSLYIPGVTCFIRMAQSRRQKRKAKDFSWVIYNCEVCKKEFRIEVQQPIARERVSEPVPFVGTTEGRIKTETPANAGRKRRRERLQGLKGAIEKAKAEKTQTSFGLLDLMKVD